MPGSTRSTEKKCTQSSDCDRPACSIIGGEVTCGSNTFTSLGLVAYAGECRTATVTMMPMRQRMRWERCAVRRSSPPRIAGLTRPICFAPCSLRRFCPTQGSSPRPVASAASTISSCCSLMHVPLSRRAVRTVRLPKTSLL